MGSDFPSMNKEDEGMRGRGGVRKGLTLGMAFLLVAMVFAAVPVSVGAKFEGGNGSAEDPYQISTVDQLQDMKKHLSAHYILVNDIDASSTSTWNDGAGFIPVGPSWGTRFTGSLDGDGYKISGLNIDRSTWDYVGLFGFIDEGSTVKDVGLEDLSVVGKDRVGGLAGYNSGTISNSYATGSATGSYSVGVLVGANVHSGLVVDSHASGSASGDIGVGGLVGSNWLATIRNSYASSSASCSNAAGGLVGDSTGLISDSYATGLVTGPLSVGGLVGQNAGVIKDSYATGNVVGTYWYAGGLCGRNIKDGFISGSYATGSVSAVYWFVGGFVGYNTCPIVDSYATGSVSGTDYTGGFVGRNLNGPITHSYASGSVSGITFVGGLVGVNQGTLISGSYATGNVQGSSRIGGLVGINYKGATISDSYSTGSASGADTVGGLVGTNYESSILNSYATGSATATGTWSKVGGLVGQNYIATVTRSYSTGPVSGQVYYVGGMVGQYISGSISSSYWDKETSGQSYSQGGIGKTTVQMKLQATFVSWDFIDVWDIIGGTTYPYLRYPPVANAGPDQTVLVGETVSFDGGASYDPFGGIMASYAWTFGDTNSGTGETPTHTYTAVGTYTVTLTVTDAVGLMDSDVCQVTVITPTQATQDLSTTVKGMGLNTGVEDNLLSKLDAALGLMDKGKTNGASRKLSDFIDYANAQSGKKLTEEQADALIATAQWIIDNL
jgi:hypothetical protein